MALSGGIFILDNSDKYIEILGKKDFNAKLSEVMHPHLFWHIIGGAKSDKAEYDSYKEFIKKYDLKNKELLFAFWRLGDSRMNDSFNKFFDTVIKEYKTLDVNEHFRIMPNSIDYLLQNASPKQKKQLLATLQASQALQNDYMKEAYKPLFDKF